MVLLSPLFLFFAALAQPPQQICPEHCTSCSRIIRDELDLPEAPWTCTLCQSGTSLCADQLCRVNCLSTATETTTTTTTTTSMTPSAEENSEAKCSDNCLRCDKGECTRCLNDNEWTLVDGICKTKIKSDEMSDTVKVCLILTLMCLLLICWAIIYSFVQQMPCGSPNDRGSSQTFSGKQTTPRGEAFFTQNRSRQGRRSRPHAQSTDPNI